MSTSPASLLLDAIHTETGDREVSARWAADHRDDVRLVDIREPHEPQGPLGAIDGVENIPLLTLLGNAASLDRDEPLLLICRSGRRSGRAADALSRAGVRAVASVEGGMIAWNTEVLGKHDILRQEKVANSAVLSEAIYRTNGVPEVSAAWVSNNFGHFRLIDIREAPELRATGKVAQAEHIAMAAFMAQAQSMDRDTPMVVMCASGGRSGRVVAALASAGFSSVASLEGGMFGWMGSGLPAARV